MNDDLKKKKKRLEQLAIEIEDKKNAYYSIVEEHKKLIIIQEKEYNNVVNNANDKINIAAFKVLKTKKAAILASGEYLESNPELVGNDVTKISKRLQADFKGMIKPFTLWDAVKETWVSKSHSQRGKKGMLMSKVRSYSHEKPLTEYDKKYVELHEEKVHRNEHIVALIDGFLGLTESEKEEVFKKVKKVGTPYHKALIDEAYNNMLRIIKSLNDADIPALLGDIRFLQQILTNVADMALAEHEQRKRKKEMTGQ